MKRLALATLVLLCSCGAPPRSDEALTAPLGAPRAIALPASAGAAHVEANWKERLAQPYVFLEPLGDYRRLGDAMRRLNAESESVGIDVAGLPFALFFDDPGRVAADALRARVCLPVAERPARLGVLRFDTLPRAMVVYARVPGAYPEAARSYPALFSYLRELGWSVGGPVREVYQASASASELDLLASDALVTEVQIPWTARAE